MAVPLHCVTVKILTGSATESGHYRTRSLLVGPLPLNNVAWGLCEQGGRFQTSARGAQGRAREGRPPGDRWRIPDRACEDRKPARANGGRPGAGEPEGESLRKEKKRPGVFATGAGGRTHVRRTASSQRRERTRSSLTRGRRPPTCPPAEPFSVRVASGEWGAYRIDEVAEPRGSVRMVGLGVLLGIR